MLYANPFTNIDELKLILNNNPDIDTSRKIEGGSSIHDMFLRNFGRIKKYKIQTQLLDRENVLLRRINEQRLRDADNERQRTGRYVEPVLEPLAVYRGIPNPDETSPEVLDELEILLYDYENKQKNQ